MNGDLNKQRSTSILNLLAKEGIDRLLSLAQLVTIISGSLLAFYFYIMPSQDQILSQKLDVIIKAHAALASGFDQKDTMTDLYLNKVDLKGQDFKKFDLSSIDIPGADFSYSNITLSNFNNANLQSVDFEGASVTDTDFAYANLANATFDQNFYASSQKENPGAGDQFTGATLPSDFLVYMIPKIACTRAPGATEDIKQTGKPDINLTIVEHPTAENVGPRQIARCSSTLTPDKKDPAINWPPYRQNDPGNSALVILCCGFCGAMAQAIRLSIQRTNDFINGLKIFLTYEIIFGFFIGIIVSPIGIWLAPSGSSSTPTMEALELLIFVLFASYFLTDTLDAIFKSLFLKNS